MNSSLRNKASLLELIDSDKKEEFIVIPGMKDESTVILILFFFLSKGTGGLTVNSLIDSPAHQRTFQCCVGFLFSASDSQSDLKIRHGVNSETCVYMLRRNGTTRTSRSRQNDEEPHE